MQKQKPTEERIKEFAEFVRVHWDGENLADAFRDYGEAEPPLHPDMMQVLEREISFRRALAE